MSIELETTIISGILHVPDYQCKVLPYIKSDIFEAPEIATIFDLTKDYYDKYNKMPSGDVLQIELKNKNGLPEKVFQEARSTITKLFNDKMVQGIKNKDTDWMIDVSEKYVVNRTCLNAVYDAHAVVTGENKKVSLEAIPDILKAAVNISFDSDIGHDYMEDADKRFDFYHNVLQRIPFSLSLLNHVTKGGIPRKSLCVPVAPTGVGKSVFMTDWSAYLLNQGHNVLYVTLEMSEERIAERIDAKLMNVTVDDLYTLSRDIFTNKINSLKKKSIGKIIIKEYPTGSFTANSLRHLLQELKAKKGFVPDVIMVDYLNLVASYRVALSGGSYGYIKAVTEELRGIAMQYDCVLCAPTQTNRSGQNATDFELNEVSESHGVSMTADLMFGIISTPDLEALGHLRIKQLKNRFGNLFAPNSFLIGAHRAKMTLFDVDTVKTLDNKGRVEKVEKVETKFDNDVNSDDTGSFMNKKPVIKNQLKF